MSDTLDERISELAHLSQPELRQHFQHAFHKTPATRTSRELLRLALAYRLQEEVLGGLPAPTKRQLTRLEARLREGKPACPAPAIRIKPGTRLLRTWNGERHQVTVLEDGFEYRGRHDNLSAIAREITGTRWSGPVFFGLKRPGQKEAADA